MPPRTPRLTKIPAIPNVHVPQKRYISSKIPQNGVGWLRKALYWTALGASGLAFTFLVNWKTYTDHVARKEDFRLFKEKHNKRREELQARGVIDFDAILKRDWDPGMHANAATFSPRVTVETVKRK